ncbi:hypothetical protein ASF22_21675 [Methylobacterium sp. Leaf87]|uniref:hypothetical protein n=1 Tax=Methylobacterium sp. Leaf87 TaxID=1736243 RepID=UPI0006F26158|nr:hypothetical protein [Methylobacterium sp. Leaf87]KQO64021.1 hypothetical protein ASF22_21675 [Methylobacterium sp. Leaf87]USU32199.1 hypothetical protein NG677_00190 [Methylobacterium sp. OTU13CASTA1]
MRFYVDHDLGAEIRFWVVPDNPLAISRVFVAVEGRRVAEIPATITDDGIRANGWHSTGHCVFRLTPEDVPGLAEARRVEIYDTDTNVLIYRRIRQDGLRTGKVLLVDTSIVPETRIPAALFDRFQQSYLGVGRLSDEVLRVLFESPWLASSFVSGAIIVPRYEGFFASDDFITTALIHDPYTEMATRMLWLKARAAVAADPAQAWRLGGLAEAADFTGDYDFDDPKSLKRFFKMMPEGAYHLLYNPLARQFGTKLPNDRMTPGNSIVAIEILARVNVVGHREFYEAFATTVFDRLGVEAVVPEPEPIPETVLALAARLRGLRAAQDMLVFDVAMADAVRDAVAKGWTV